jgi:hypothetical protein
MGGELSLVFRWNGISDVFTFGFLDFWIFGFLGFKINFFWYSGKIASLKNE